MNELRKEEIKKLIASEHPIILDIGAYDGKDGRELAAMFKKCYVHSFEPINYVEPFNNGIIYKLAIGSRQNVLTPFIFPKAHPQSGSLRNAKEHLEIFPEIQFDCRCWVVTVRLDDLYFAENIDFIWCDVNGSEGDVIKGATETLKKTKYLYIEFSDKELYEGQITKSELLAMLPDWEVMGEYNFKGNFGNLLLKNNNVRAAN